MNDFGDTKQHHCALFKLNDKPVNHVLQVASVVGRAEVFSCIFFLLSVLLYIRAISVSSGASLQARSRMKWNLAILSIVLSACSMLSKEQGVMAIGMCAGFDVLLHWDMVWSTLMSKNKTQSCTKHLSTTENPNGTVNLETDKKVTENGGHRIGNGSIVEMKGKRGEKGKHNSRTKDKKINDPWKDLVTRIGKCSNV